MGDFFDLKISILLTSNGESLASFYIELDFPVVHVSEFKTQLSKIKESPGRGIVITSFAPNGLGFTFNNRFFSHKLRIDEDLVCGSTHSPLEAYWHEKL
ncbi:hypothetical protein E3N88_37720 [Mikania micrantha]|uniref:Uncharacterized protein n=1 Tax=Mikania micrantha TaxID=192012 RepID=A0A5N6LS10_9ASTR|nr:hypothetical protein E3N88_37720 [Mikania micrantha]